jgi:hypothetical protein
VKVIDSNLLSSLCAVMSVAILSVSRANKSFLIAASFSAPLNEAVLLALLQTRKKAAARCGDTLRWQSAAGGEGSGGKGCRDREHNLEGGQPDHQGRRGARFACSLTDVQRTTHTERYEMWDQDNRACDGRQICHHDCIIQVMHKNLQELSHKCALLMADACNHGHERVWQVNFVEVPGGASGL